MQAESENVYYNPLDPRCWKAIAIGLPLLLVAITALATIGWLVHGQSAATGPVVWVYKPWILAEYAALGAYVAGIAAALAWTMGLLAHAIGRSLVDSRRQNRSN